MEHEQFSGTPEGDVLSVGPGNGQIPNEPPRRKRGRPPGSRKAASLSSRAPLTHTTGRNGVEAEPSTEPSPISQPLPDDGSTYPSGEVVKPTPFSSLLRGILRHERPEITRVARDLEVAENTIYRWMNGSSEPRPIHLRRLPDVLPEHRGNLTVAINATFPGLLDASASGIQEVRKDIYARVLDLVYTVEEPDSRLWQITQALFEYALLHLDAERQGMAITYAALMPPHPDGIHSLREAVTRGSDPWPNTLESKAFLGSTTLAGSTAVLQRLRVWNSADRTNRLLVDVDEFEASACASPVMRGGRIAGVLIISSTLHGFFNDSMACKAVDEYSRLLSTALLDKDFYSYADLNLKPMPSLRWQRDYIAENFISRILTYARRYAISRTEAELRVRQEAELHFEEVGRAELDRQRSSGKSDEHDHIDTQIQQQTGVSRFE